MPGIDVNDIHSQLNPTTVDRIVPVDSLEAIQAAIAAAQGRKETHLHRRWAACHGRAAIR